MDFIIREGPFGKTQLVVPGYYNQLSHIEKTYTDGLYGQIPVGFAENFWNKNKSRCQSWMEWAYNNPYQPTAEWSPSLQAYQPFLDASEANSVSNLGSLKTIWKTFERIHKLHELPLAMIDINVLEERFWDYYITNYSHKFEHSVKILENYIHTRRILMTVKDREIERQHIPIFADDKTWIAGCRDYLKHLVYTTPRGYLYELILFAILQAHTNGYFQESSIPDERKGIDGYIITDKMRYPVSLKPSTYTKKYASPLYRQCWITYFKRDKYFPDLVFEFQSGEDIIK